MFTSRDIEFRTIFVIDCIHNRNLRVSNGELLLEETTKDDKVKTLTKLPFQKIFALFIVGHISITTPLIEKCQKYGVALIVVKPNYRPIFFWSSPAEANYLLRQRQHQYTENDNLTIAKILVTNKIQNQSRALIHTRMKDTSTTSAIEQCNNLIPLIQACPNYSQLMGIEGSASKAFFSAFFQSYNWQARRPRTKCDAINATLDIGYTILFYYIECFLRLFGFDLYVGVYHRLWFKRKSLVCDIMEPFRCIIDKTVRIAFNRKQISDSDFKINNGEYILKREKNKVYQKLFFDALIPYKIDTFKYVQAYYRCFMQKKSEPHFPQFNI